MEMMVESNTICRLCAESKPDIIGVNDSEGLKLGIQVKSAKYLNIHIAESDELPQSVCIDCCVLLNQCSEFYELTNQAQVSLKNALIKSNTSSEESEKKADVEFKSNPVLNDSNQVEPNLANVENCDEEETVQVKEEETPNGETSKEAKKKSKKRSKKKSSSDSEDFKNEPDAVKEIMSKKKLQKILETYEWLCTDCNDKLPSLQMLEKHHQTVHNQKAKYMCVQCSKIYVKFYGFLSHIKRHSSKAKYNCDDCGKSFDKKKILESHRVIHSDNRPHKCDICGKAFKQQSALCIHSRCHLPEDVKNRYPCDQCDKRFSTKPNLVTHKRIHSGIRNFTCDQCGKSFIQKGNLEAHFLTHSADKPYNCVQCSKAFKSPLQLKKHESVHTGAKPHQCATCGRTFREKSTLREHNRIHTGDMPFICDFCGKAFRFKGILTTHRRQHTGERPYSCVECQHHFTNWPNYNKHMKRRHGIDTSRSKNSESTYNPRPVQLRQEDQQEILDEEHQRQIHIIQQSEGDCSSQEAEEILPHGPPSSFDDDVESPSSSAQYIQAIPTSLLQNSSITDEKTYYIVPVLPSLPATNSYFPPEKD